MENKKYIFTLSAILLSMFSLNVCASEFGNLTEQQITIEKTPEKGEKLNKNVLTKKRQRTKEKTTQNIGKHSQKKRLLGDKGFSKKEQTTTGKTKEETTEQGEKLNKNVLTKKRRRTKEKTTKEKTGVIKEFDKRDEEKIETKKQNENKFNNIKSDFVKEDYENDGFKLDVKFVKENKKLNIGGIDVLIYENIKTGLYHVFFLHDDPNILQKLEDTIYFISYVTNPKGINHIIEHLFINISKENLKNAHAKGYNSGLKISARTGDSNIHLKIGSDFSNKENNAENFVEKIEYAKKTLEDNPERLESEVYSIFKVGDKEREIGRIYHEMINNVKELYKKQQYNFVLTNKEDKNDISPIFSGGLPEEIKNYNLEEIKRVFKKVFHPSNAIVFYNLPKNPGMVKEKLKLFENWCNQNEKVNIFEENLEDFEKQKNIERDFLLKHKHKKVYKDGSGFTNYYAVDEKTGKSSKKVAKYSGIISKELNLGELEAKDKQIFSNIRSDSIVKMLKDKVKELGYEYVELTARVNIWELKFYGNDEEKFKDDVLRKNSIFLLKELFKIIKNMKENDYKKVFCRFDDYNINFTKNRQKEDNNASIVRNLQADMLESFKKRGTPISQNEIFYKGDNLIVDNNSLMNNIKEILINWI